MKQSTYLKLKDRGYDPRTWSMKQLEDAVFEIVAEEIEAEKAEFGVEKPDVIPMDEYGPDDMYAHEEEKAYEEDFRGLEAEASCAICGVEIRSCELCAECGKKHNSDPYPTDEESQRQDLKYERHDY